MWLVLVEALDGMSKVHNQFSETFDTLHKELSEYHQMQKDRFKKNVSALEYVCSYTCVQASSSSCICNQYLYICGCIVSVHSWLYSMTVSVHLYIHTYTDIHTYIYHFLYVHACLCIIIGMFVFVRTTTYIRKYIWTCVFVRTSILHTCS